MLPLLAFALFGAVLVRSDVSQVLAAALNNAEVLVTGVFAAGGWILSSYLSHVEKRFDDLSKQLEGLKELNELLLQRRSACS